MHAPALRARRCGTFCNWGCSCAHGCFSGTFFGCCRGRDAAAAHNLQGTSPCFLHGNVSKPSHVVTAANRRRLATREPHAGAEHTPCAWRVAALVRRSSSRSASRRSIESRKRRSSSERSTIPDLGPLEQRGVPDAIVCCRPRLGFIAPASFLNGGALTLTPECKPSAFSTFGPTG